MAILAGLLLPTLALPAAAAVENGLYKPGHFQPLNADFTFTKAVPAGDGIDFSIGIKAGTAGTFKAFVRCGPSFGADPAGEVEVATANAPSSLTLAYAGDPCVTTGQQIASGVAVREVYAPGAYGNATWTGQVAFGNTLPATVTGSTLTSGVFRVAGIRLGTGCCNNNPPQYQLGLFNAAGVQQGSATSEDSGGFDISAANVTAGWYVSVRLRVSAGFPSSTQVAKFQANAQPAGEPQLRAAYRFDPTGAQALAPGSDCVLSDPALVRVARNAGFTPPNLATAVAVALAESGGLVGAVNYNTGNDSNDIGLWQINDRAHPTYDVVKLGSLANYNAAAAFEVFTTAASSFSPWVTFTSRAYKKFESRAFTAVAAEANTQDIASCSDLGPGDATGGADAPDPEEEDHCGFSLNPLNAVKCLLLPSPGTLDKVTGLGEDLGQVFPIGYVTGTLQQVNVSLGACAGGESACGDQDGGFAIPRPQGVSNVALGVLTPESPGVSWIRENRNAVGFLVWVSVLGPLVGWVLFRLFPVVNE